MVDATKRIVGIDLAKCIACMGVILIHISGLVFYGNGTVINTPSVMPSKVLYYLGSCAVPLFFISNGFFILNKKKISWSYIWKKIYLLLTPVIIWNFMLFIGYVIKNDSSNSFITLILESLSGKGIFFQFWFLGSLLILLIMAKFLNELLKKSIKSYCFILIILLITSLSIDLYNHFSAQAPIQKDIILTFRLWTWLFYYMSGGLLGFLYRNSIQFKIILCQKKRLISLSLVTLSILFIIYAVLDSKLINSVFADYNYDNLLFIVWSIILFIFFLGVKKLSDYSSRMIESISKYSFGIYIVHVLFIKIFRHFIVINSITKNILAIIFVFVGSYILVATLSKIPIIRKLVAF